MTEDELVVIMVKFPFPGYWQECPHYQLQDAEAKLFRGKWKTFHQNAIRLSKSKMPYEYAIAYNNRDDANLIMSYLKVQYPHGQYQLWSHYMPRKENA